MIPLIIALWIGAALMVLGIGQRPRRWGDRDHYFGPLTVAWNDKHWRPITFMLSSSGEDDDRPMLRVSLHWFTVILATPNWLLRPHREWREVPQWLEDGTAARLGRSGYWNTNRREYGLTYSEGYLSLHFGTQAMDSSIDQQWGCFLPWMQWRHVRHDLLDLEGRLFWRMRDNWRDPVAREEDRYHEEVCPNVRFNFLDFDGEAITATTRIEEREWHRGTGWFHWLAWFWPARIKRYLDLRFSSEVGKRKGSWKGGTLGHSTKMQPGETPEIAFMHYCEREGLTFAGVTDNYLAERYGITEKPADWNVAVLGHFHGGPEKREPGDEYRQAFHERAGQPVDPDPSAA